MQVCRVLGDGVLEALALLVGTLAAGTRPAAMPVLFEQSLTVLYRVLFLLFAEARGLLPVWHPVYRDRYSLDTIVTALLRGQRYWGLAGRPGDLTARACRMQRRRASRHGLQRPPLLPGAGGRIRVAHRSPIR